MPKPVRTCAVCQKEEDPTQLVRWVRAPDGSVFPDLRASSWGRGAWVHPTPSCMRRLPQGLARSFRESIGTSAEEATELLAQAGAARVNQLLGAARRQKLALVGSTVVQDAWFRGDAALILVAQDARAAAELACVRAAISEGKAQVWGTKDGLGQLFGRPEVGILAILDQRLATGLFGAIAMALLAPGRRIGATEPSETVSVSNLGNDVSTEAE